MKYLLITLLILTLVFPGFSQSAAVSSQREISANQTKGVKIISMPKPDYTESARNNNVQGVITLMVIFNNDATIGDIVPLNGLPYGLTEQAIAAARKIKFEPAMKDGVAYSVRKKVSYSFETR